VHIALAEQQRSPVQASIKQSSRTEQASKLLEGPPAGASVPAVKKLPHWFKDTGEGKNEKVRRLLQYAQIWQLSIAEPLHGL